MAVHVQQNGWHTEGKSPLPVINGRNAAGFPPSLSSTCKRPLQNDSPMFPDDTVEQDGSPPKRVTYCAKQAKSQFSNSNSSSQTAMAPVQETKDLSPNITVALNSRPSNLEGSVAPGSPAYSFENGHSQSSGRPRSVDEKTNIRSCGPDFLVALYGCTGYGESSLKSSSSQSSLHVSSSGGMGSACDSASQCTWDEDAQTVLLAWAVVDASLNQLVVTGDCLIRHGRDSSQDPVLHENFRAESGLDEDDIEKNGISLESALKQLDDTIRTRTKGAVLLVTLGSELIRQQIIPECVRRGIKLPDYFFSFVDLLQSQSDTKSPALTGKTKTLNELLENNRLVSTSAGVCADYGKRHVTDMAKLLQFMVHNGCDFSQAQHVTPRYEPGLCKAEDVADGCVVKTRGLPWQASDFDVSRFFVGLNIPRGGIALCLSSNGRRNGEAVVLFSNQQQRDLALQRHRNHMEKRYVEVYKATALDFQQVAGVATGEAHQFLQRNVNVIVRMRGLPYDATAEQVVDFFRNGDAPVSVLDGEAGVLFVRSPNEQRPTGDAFVLFGTEEDGKRAIAKHRQTLGSRYVELFRSTAAEVSQVLNKTACDRDGQKPLISTPPLLSGFNGIMGFGGSSPVVQLTGPVAPLLGGGVQRNCIRLRGLPFNSGVEDILDFLGHFSKHIVVQGVHMVFNAQGQASGEAFIQMDSEAAAFQTVHDRHNQYMNLRKYGKKDRYVEVYQCSADEMNGNAAAPPLTGVPSMCSVISPGLAGISPYMTRNVNAFTPNFQLGLLPQTSPVLRPGLLPGMLQLPYFNYNTQPMSLTNAFSSSVIPGLPNLTSFNAPVSPGNFSFVYIRNLPFKISVNDIVAFLHGTGLLGPECVQINRHSDGRPNGEAFVIYATREEAERAVHSCNRRSLGNRHVDMSVLA